jgi:hypothetical protein
MSQDVFPTLPGLSFPWRRSPLWKTHVRTTASDREYRASNITYPRYRYSIAYEFLRARPSLQEWQVLEAFFNERGGRLGSFLFNDPSDNQATDQVFAQCDGVRTSWPLARSLGGFVMAVGALQGSPDIRWSGDWRGPSTPIRLTSRTNRALRSQDFTSGSWAKDGTTITADAAAAPDGTGTADLMVDDLTNGQHSISQVPTFDSQSSPYVSSIYVKSNGQRWVKIRGHNNGKNSSAWANFDIIDGVAGLAQAQNGNSILEGSKIQAVPGATGWYRIEVATRHFVNSDKGSLSLYMLTSDTAAFEVYTGTGTGGMYIWQGQIETGLDTDEAGLPIVTTSGNVTITDASVDDYAIFTMVFVPPSGIELSWTGNFYWRARFDKDEMNFSQFAKDYWSCADIGIITLKAE